MKKVLIIFLSIVVVLGFSIQYDISGNAFDFIDANSFIWFVELAFIYMVLQMASNMKEKRLWITSGSIAFVLASFAIMGFFASNYSNGEIAHYTVKFVLFLFAKWITWFICFATIISIGYDRLKNKLKNENEKERKEYKFFTNNKKSILIVALIILLAYIPYYLNYFPGNGMPDSVTEVLQAIGVQELTNHHPAMHILLIRFCFTIGNLLFNNYVAGYVIYMILQILFACFTFSYAIYYMAKKRVRLPYRIISLLFFMFCPVLTLYNTTLLKDVPFALCVLLYTIFYIEMIINLEEFARKKSKWILLFFILLGTLFFRNNGIYVIILSFPFLLWFARKHYKPILTIFIIAIAIYKIVTGPVYNHFGIKQGSTREALSIPLQQFARISKYKEEYLTQEEKEKIYQYLPVENLGELYHPLSSDPVKNNFSEKGFEQDKFGLIKLYIKLALKYPGQTIYSFINNSYGYYYPDTIGWGITYGINQQEFKNSKSENFGLDRKPIIEIKAIDKIHNFINEKDIPLFSMIASPGFYFWLMCIAIGYCIYDRKYKLLLGFLPILVVWLTCLASPVFCENRYIYSLYVAFPTLMSFTLIDINKEEKKDK